MHRPALIVSGAIVMAAILSVAFLGNRYEILVQPDQSGIIYKLDKRSGHMWLVDGTQVEDVDETAVGSKSVQSPEDRAIALASTQLMPTAGAPSMGQTIQDSLRSMKGILRVYGWHARRIDDQAYLVGYTYDAGPGSEARGWFFEVNLKANIVRNIIGDPDLEKKYAGVLPGLNR